MYLIQIFVHILRLTSTNVINQNVDPQNKQTRLFRLNDTSLISKTVYGIIKSLVYIILHYIINDLCLVLIFISLCIFYVKLLNNILWSIIFIFILLYYFKYYLSVK